VRAGTEGIRTLREGVYSQMSNLSEIQSGTEILNFRAIQERCGISEATVRRRVADGSWPQPLRLSLHRVGFLLHEVEEALMALPRGFKKAA